MNIDPDLAKMLQEEGYASLRVLPDGVHPSSVGHVAAATRVNAWALTIAP